MGLRASIGRRNHPSSPFICGHLYCAPFHSIYNLSSGAHLTETGSTKSTIAGSRRQKTGPWRKKRMKHRRFSVGEAAGRLYFPWWIHGTGIFTMSPPKWTVETHKAFGHLKTQGIYHTNSKDVGFWGPMAYGSYWALETTGIEIGA